MFDKDKFKKGLTVEDIQKVLEYYKADYHIDNSGNLVTQTICHNKSDGSHKLYYYPDGHSFHCYTGCGSFDIYELVQKVNKTRGVTKSFTECIREVASILGVNVSFRNTKKGITREVKTIDDWDWLKKVQRREHIKPELKFHDKRILKYFTELYPSAWYDEGISIESMEKYGIRFYPEMFQTVIPHLDQYGNLIGIRSRNWDEEYVKRAKYIPTYIGDKGYNHPLGYALYGLYQNKDTIQKKKKAMIVEGEKSCLFSDTMYGKDNFVVAMCGSNLNKYQADLLLEQGIEQIIIAVDKEYETLDSDDYKEYMFKVMKIAKLFTPYITTYHLTDTRGIMQLKQSPLDLSKEELEDMMENDKHLITLKDYESED